MAPPVKRRKYDAGFKLQVIKFAKSSNNCATASKFGICEKLVRDWKKNESIVMKMPTTKCAMRGGTSHWPEMEKHISEWVLENRRKGYIVTRSAIRCYALMWAESNPELSQGFRATAGWFARFMDRKSLGLRPKTTNAIETGNSYWPDWESEQVAVMFPEGRVIRVCSGDPESCWTTVETVLEKANDELGILFTSKLSMDASAYLYVREGHVLGCVIAEPIQVAYHELENGGDDIVKVEIPDDDEVFVVIETSSFCSNTPIRGNLCGINRMWTCASERRNGIATKMLDAIRTTFVDGHILRRDEIAFADPTPLGIAFARKYTKLPNFLTYKLNKD